MTTLLAKTRRLTEPTLGRINRNGNNVLTCLSGDFADCSSVDGGCLSRQSTRSQRAINSRLSAAPSIDDTNTRLLSGVGGGCASHQNSQQLQQRSRHQEKKQDSKAAKTLSAILLAFIITWTPYNVLIIIKGFEQPVPDIIYEFS